jgi:putative transposase
VRGNYLKTCWWGRPLWQPEAGVFCGMLARCLHGSDPLAASIFLNLRKLKGRQGRLGDHWHLDEVLLRINGHLQDLWHAIDQDGHVIDILVQSLRDRRAAERFFRRLLRGQGREPLCIVTDKLRSYSPAMRTSFCNVAHTTERYANNRMEASHQPTRQRERQMRRFKSAQQAQGFLSLQGAVHNLFRLGRHLVRSENYRFLRSRSFSIWRTVTQG